MKILINEEKIKKEIVKDNINNINLQFDGYMTGLLFFLCGFGLISLFIVNTASLFYIYFIISNILLLFILSLYYLKRFIIKKLNKNLEEF